MKCFLILLFMFYAMNSWATCFSPISRTNIHGGQIPTSTKYNNDFNNLYNRANDVPGDCFTDSSLMAESFADSLVTTEKIANSTITAQDFAAGVIPTYRKPLRIKAYTSSGTWVKSNDVGAIVVHVVGGGGASGNTTLAAVGSGGTSSFGAHCSANGGNGGTEAACNGSLTSGGSASNGDLNLVGGSGTFLYGLGDGGTPGQPGESMFSQFGRGGRAYVRGTDSNFSCGAGGGGGYCMKRIERSSLNDSESVTVGAAGVFNYDYPPNGTQTPATAGIVLIYEYAQ